MTKHKGGISTRTLVAVALVSASFLSSFALSRAANRSELMWSASSVLLPGRVIHSGDLILKRAALPDGAGEYVLQSVQLVGYQVLRPIGAGELIPISAVNRDARGLTTIDVPISVQASDAPTGLTVGQVINIYHVDDSQGSQKIAEPSLVLADIYILDIDRKSQSMSSAISLTLSIPNSDVVPLLGATGVGRIVVVRKHG